MIWLHSRTGCPGFTAFPENSSHPFHAPARIGGNIAERGR